MSTTPHNKLVSVIRIDDVIYDSEALARIHPGGPLGVLQADGTDATAFFNTTHRRPFPHKNYTKYAVDPKNVPASIPVPPRVTANQDWASYWELCERLKPILDTPAGNHGFAPWYYFVKVALLLFSSLYLDYRFIVYGRTVVLSIVAGIIRACIGLNIQHDANHGAVSRNGTVNRVLGLTQDYLGGSSLSWSINHNVIHHTVCNDTIRDGDLNITLVRLKKAVPWMPVHTMQHIYIWALEFGFGPLHMIMSTHFNWMSPESRRPVLVPFFTTNRILSLMTIARIIVTYWCHPTASTMWLTALEYCFGGLWLAFFFILSHNFEGVRKEGVDYGLKTDFVQNQVETSSNVGGDLLILTNGGLNIQIEHHMFPRVSHCYYGRIAPVVREFCREKGFKYTHFPTLWENVKSTYAHLKSLGRKPDSKNE